MNLARATGWSGRELQEATDALQGYPEDPPQRGRGCPPPPAGRTLHYAPVVDDDAIAVDARWENMRGRIVPRGPQQGREVPDVAPEPGGDRA